MKRLLGVAVCVALGAGQATAQDRLRVTIGDVGPGASGRILQEVVSGQYRLLEPDTAWFTQRRGETESGTIVVLGRSAGISGSVDGDVVVVGGDLFVRPGAHIGGRAVAIGGGVYPSALAIINGGALSFRDNSFNITRIGDGYRLDYVSLRDHASRPLLLPGVFGLRAPTYDRVNGASIPFGPALTFAGGRGEADFLVTYRSDLGKIDPSVLAALQLSRRARVRLAASRGTFTNDSWIWSNFVNSLSSLAFGVDTRNWFRADRAELTVHRVWESASVQIEPFVGALAERAWSVGPAVGEQQGPWSMLGRKDTLGMWRPNPEILNGSIGSGLVGTGVQWESQGLRLRARTRAELGSFAPPDRRFMQLTSDLDVTFPTFGEQEYAMDAHWVTTPGDAPPPQRFAYLGGAGTLLFHPLLSFGGDELLLIDQRYSYPLLGLTLGLLGSPTLVFRHRIGSAGLTKLPDFEQIVGVGVLLTLVRAELFIDPATGSVRLTGGLSFSR